MSSEKHVKMIIRADGTCSIDAMNFSNATCLQATQQLMAALQASPLDERFKPESQRLPPQAHLRAEGAR